jgi:hypothetical protein
LTLDHLSDVEKSLSNLSKLHTVQELVCLSQMYLSNSQVRNGFYRIPFKATNFELKTKIFFGGKECYKNKRLKQPSQDAA